jgi:hypothetical protein
MQSLLYVGANGHVGIGIMDTKGYKLAVAGEMIAERVKVEKQSNWADFVFQPEYKLPPLSEVESFIRYNRHLPEIPTAAEVEKNGFDLGDMNKKLLQKIEELTLYMIDLKKENTELRSRVEKLEKQ